MKAICRIIILYALLLPTLLPDAKAASDEIDAKGLNGLTDIETLPFLKFGVHVDFIGSIAKDGSNDDNIWWLYQDAKTAEWVIFDVDGPGCIYQLYNHRGHPGYRSAPESQTVSDFNAPDTVYRFYFDGAEQPQFTIRASKFGSLPGFESPLTDMYENWVKRTWFPMFFRSGCKITASAKLTTPPGGWGTVVYHSYATPENVPTFQEFLPRLPEVRKTLSVRPGADPKPADGNERNAAELPLSPGMTQTAFEKRGCASVSEISLSMTPYRPELLRDIHVKIYFDDETVPFVDLPFGEFFANPCGATSTETIMQGLRIEKNGEEYISASGYNFFPMPFWKSARIELAAAESLAEPVRIKAEWSIRPTEKRPYPKERCGYFHAVGRDPFTPPNGEDTVYASIRGTGHLVCGTFASTAVCEEDFRFYVDGCGTAKIESDGAESWAGFGWGFVGPYSGPLTCQDKYRGWTQTRNLIGDCYPFYNRIDVRQENLWHDVPWGWMHYKPSEKRDYHGAVCYYGLDAPTLIETDAVDVGDAASEIAHGYASDGSVVSLTSRYEGCSFEDKRYSGGFIPGEVTDSGREVKTSSEFTVAIRKENEGVRLRRRSDQRFGRQRAQVFVDGVLVTERSWYRADRNPSLRWLEDEFEIPARYTKNKDRIKIKLVFQPANADLPPRNDAPPSLPENCLTPGLFGRALRGDSFRQPLQCELNSPKPEYTVDFRIRFHERPRNIQHIMLWRGFWDILTDNGYLVVRTDPKLGKTSEDKNGNKKWSNIQRTALDAMIADGQWHHIALSENGRRLCLLVDGKRVFDETVERQQPFAERGKLTVGYRDPKMMFEGELDDLRFSSIFRDSLSVSDSCAVPDADTFALWTFDETAGADRIANAAAESPALLAGVKPPLFEVIPADAPASTWSEYYYRVFTYTARP